MLGNAAAAAVLAVLAAALSYFVRAPAVRHAAWLLVPLKLVTPPLVSLPLPVLPASWVQPAGSRSRETSAAFRSLTTSATARDVDVPAIAGVSGPSLTDGLLLAWAAGALGWFA